MENASKALIIAGAILISILIIGLSVYIYNNASSTIKRANLGSQEAQAQNKQFEEYFRKNVSASEVKDLVSLVRSNNITSTQGQEDKSIAIVFDNKFKLPNEVSIEVKAGTTYDVGVVDDETSNEDPITAKATSKSYYENGYLRVIKITSNPKGKQNQGN